MDLTERSSDNSIRHPWEVARFNFYLDLLRQSGVLDTQRWLDVGSGDAWFARSLRERLSSTASITCWDSFYTSEDLEMLDERTPNVYLTAERPELRFEGVLMLDVVEHVADDLGFVSDIVRDVLLDEGWVLVSVPAYQFLYTDHDRRLKHYRRYSPRRMRDVLSASGLDIVSEGGVFHTLLVPRFVQAVAERFRHSQGSELGIGGWRQGSALTRVVTLLLSMECRLSLLLSRQHRIIVPGLSYWALCRKSDHVE